MANSARDPKLALDELRRTLSESEIDASRAADALLVVLEAEAAATIDEVLVQQLVALLGSVGRTAQRRLSEVLQPLARQHAGCRAALEAALASAEASLRWGAAYTLGNAFGPSEALAGPILEMLGDEDGDSRWAAAELACAWARRHASFEDELRAATRAESSALRRMALYCLRNLGVPDLTDLARERLGDPDAYGRLAGLTALAAARPASAQADAAVPVVQRLVEADPDAGVRRAAAIALGRLLPAASASARTAGHATLERAAADSDASLAHAAAKALRS